VNGIPGLQVLGDPTMTVFAYRATDPAVNVYAVADRMEARGWHLDRQQKPDSLHVMVSAAHVGLEERYLADLREAVDEVRADPSLATAGGAATYGMISAVPLRGLIRKQVLRMMMDAYGPGGGAIDVETPGDDLATKAGVLLVKAREELRRRLQR
jgi:sphinganine-1-phosphate aldolase